MGKLAPRRGLNYNTILQLDLFCRRKWKWLKVPYIQVSFTLKDKPDLYRDIQKSTDSLAHMVLTHREAPNYLLAEKGKVCAMINTSCCIYINISKEVEERTTRILQQATWLKERASQSLAPEV